MVKLASMTKEIKKKISELEILLETLENCVGDSDRLLVLGINSLVVEFLSKNSWLKNILPTLTPLEVLSAKSVIAIGQGANVFSHFDDSERTLQFLPQLLENLVKVEMFYDTIGGIIGYYTTVLRLLDQNLSPSETNESKEHYYKPPGINIMELYGPVNQAVRQCITNMPKLSEMYPVGGAGDRLNLKDEETGQPLPAAVLPFLGRSLLSGLIRDIQAREFLYHRLNGGQLTTPLALMTSEEKDNHQYLVNIFESKSWFGRPRDSIRFFTQPLVPVITCEGEWVMQGPFHLSMKPGGHGVLWKKALDDDIFEWLKALGRDKILVRQINNPVAAIDYGILAFLGFGFVGEKSFGFASCRRMVHAAEGMNVLVERSEESDYSYCISNVEYTDFEKKGIQDVSVDEGSCYSAFPANTNILFVDIDSVQKALSSCPIPGMIINMKSIFQNYNQEGKYIEVKGGRLESTMQNIADVIVNRFPSKQDPESINSLKTYVTYNHRRKTLSVTKSSYVAGQGIHGTPLGCFYELLQNNRELLMEHCGIKVPELPAEDEYIRKGPSFITIFHPALGPCWSIIAQKLRGGRLADKAELQLEIAEVDIENIQLEGSLLIEAQDPLGRTNEEGIVEYSRECGKCVLKNVIVSNLGIDRDGKNTYWKNQIERHEALRIVLHGNAELYAENVTISGDQFIEVDDGYRLIVKGDNGKLSFDRQKINRPSWSWEYSFNDSDQIILHRSS